MYKIIGQDQKEYGPVEKEKLLGWLKEGRVNGDTRVRVEPDGEWSALSELPELAPAPGSKGKWICPRCGEEIESQFDSCWRCSSKRGEQATAGAGVVSSKPVEAEWEVRFEVFRGTFATWDDLFTRAASFATEIGRERLISISHSEDKDDGVVTVWYWGQKISES